MRTSPRTTRPAHARKGSALLVVLWVSLVAGLILLGVQKSLGTNLATSRGELAAVQAHWLARAGVETAIAVLTDDDAGSDGAWDEWYDNPDAFQEIELPGGMFSVTAPRGHLGDAGAVRYGLIDQSGLLNLNVADEAGLKALDLLDGPQIDAILDWRDNDNTPRAGGAEGMYYERLALPYTIRNGPFQTVRELLLVRGIGPGTFAGEDADMDGLLDANENDLSASPPDDNGDGRLDAGLGGLATVWSYELNRDAFGNKRTDFNQADKKTLMEQFNFSDGLASAIAESGGSGGGKSPGDAKGGKGSNRFSSLADLLKVKAKGPARGEDEGKVNQIDLKWLAANLDRITLTDQDRLPGRINVNTASPAVLGSLPKMDRKAVDAICRRQNAGEGPFTSVGELLTAGVLTDEQFKALAERVGVRGSVFEIRSSGMTRWGVRRQIVAVVDRAAEPVTILYWHQSD